MTKATGSKASSETGSQQQGGSNSAGEQQEQSHEQRPQKAVAAWLFAMSGLVFGMVSLGGVTRLTKSGLSMTDWKIQGSLPPRSEAEWEEEFDKYKQYPEYTKLNAGMSLAEFKFIYWMEYGHRMWGRGLGIAFILPLIYFGARGRIGGSLLKRLGLLLGMGGTQGLIGWWMVRSGLEEPEQHVVPRVSPYRLATHLISAFAIYSLLLDTAFKTWTGSVSAFQGPPIFRRAAVGVTGLVALTAMSGAFVAGNEAGLVYNEFPKMGGRWFPEDAISPFLEPKWRNLFENSSLVQFNHRLLGISTALGVSALWLASRRLGPALSPLAGRASNLLLGMVGAQVTLGITTLLWLVPVPLAATHQAGALTLLSFALWFLHCLGPVGRLQTVLRVAKTARTL